jgi:protein TonB
MWLIAIVGLAAIAIEPFQLCTKADRAYFRTRNTLYLEPIARPLPKYPLITERYEGEVEVLALLRLDGQVHGVCVLRAHPSGIFEQATVDAVRRWRYSPSDVARLPESDRRVKIVVEYRLE